jgi:capsular exopolysaccharide synthesis family protein
MLAAGLVYLLEALDDTIRTIDDVQQVLNLVVLGTIPKIKRRRQKGNKGPMVATRESFSPAAEAYRTLRTNIQFSSLIVTNPAPTLLITSAGSREGKSTTVANLAIVNAQSGKQVILVDTDLRQPIQHKFFDVPNQVGLTSLLVDKKISLEMALQNTRIGNLQVLPSGPLPPNAADILASGRMEQVMAQLVGQADLILFDSPPLLAVSDASILATHVGGTILVIEAARTRSEICRRGQEILKQVGISPLGVVLNRFNPTRDVYYGYSHDNYYHSVDNGRGPQKKRQKKNNQART